MAGKLVRKNLKSPILGFFRFFFSFFICKIYYNIGYHVLIYTFIVIS